MENPLLFILVAKCLFHFSATRSIPLSTKFLSIIGVLSSIFTGLAEAKSESIYSIPVKTIEGKNETLAAHKGKVLLVVNTASECGFTSQYAGLETLYKKHRGEGLVVLGFPSNDFGGQEPGTDAEIKKFCELKYKTTFPIFGKVGVKEKTHPLYALLQKEAGESPQWNFGKYLVGRNGKVVKYFPSRVEPGSAELAKAVDEALKAK
jgi:glutathione peroxidase